jgi:hypothetical protein
LDPDHEDVDVMTTTRVALRDYLHHDDEHVRAAARVAAGAVLLLVDLAAQHEEQRLARDAIDLGLSDDVWDREPIDVPVTPKRAGSAGGAELNREIRAWAASVGIVVGAKGRIPGEVVAAFQAAQEPDGEDL